MRVGGSYRRDPTWFLSSVLMLSLEEIGAYTILSDWLLAGYGPCDAETFHRVIRVSKRAGQRLRAALEAVGLVSFESGMCVLLRPPVSQDRVPLPATLRAAILERDGEVCRYCGDDEGPFHIDHIHPVSRGGTDDPANLCVACTPCNLSKADKLLSEWAGR